MLVQAGVAVGNQELKRDVRGAEVVCQIPEQVAILPQLIKVPLLHAPVVHVDLQVYFDQVAQLDRVEERHDFVRTVWVRANAYLEARIDDAAAGLTLPDQPSFEESSLWVLLEDFLGAREDVLALEHRARTAQTLALVAQHDADIVVGTGRYAALVLVLLLLFWHEEGPSTVLLPAPGS